MKLYLDSADARQWAVPAGCPPVQGVTTNPTLVMQAGLPVSLPGYLQLVAQAGVVPVAGKEQSGMDDEDGLMGLPTDPLTSARTENAEIYLPDLGKWLEVRSRYLNWVDGRLAQMVIATDITPRRLAEEQAERQAELGHVKRGERGVSCIGHRDHLSHVRG